MHSEDFSEGFLGQALGLSVGTQVPTNCPLEVTRDLLQRSDHRSIQALEKDLRDWITAWKKNPKPFTWTKTAQEILESIARYLKRINGAEH